MTTRALRRPLLLMDHPMNFAISPVCIVTHTNLTPASKEAERRRLASLFDQYLESGGAVRVVAGFKLVPPPPRRQHIDPETVLKRRRKPTPES